MATQREVLELFRAGNIEELKRLGVVRSNVRSVWDKQAIGDYAERLLLSLRPESCLCKPNHPGFDLVHPELGRTQSKARNLKKRFRFINVFSLEEQKFDVLAIVLFSENWLAETAMELTWAEAQAIRDRVYPQPRTGKLSWKFNRNGRWRTEARNVDLVRIQESDEDMSPPRQCVEC